MFADTLKKWSGVLAALLTIGATVFFAARAGVESAVRMQLEGQIANAHSPLNRQIKAVIEQHETDICEPRWKEVQLRLGNIDVGVARVETNVNLLLERSK